MHKVALSTVINCYPEEARSRHATEILWHACFMHALFPSN